MLIIRKKNRIACSKIIQTGTINNKKIKYGYLFLKTYTPGSVAKQHMKQHAVSVEIIGDSSYLHTF